MQTYQAELIELCDAIMADEVAVDFERVKRACPYRFNFRKTPKPVHRLEDTLHARVSNWFAHAIYKIESRNDIDVVPSHQIQLLYYTMGHFYSRLVRLVDTLRLKAARIYRLLLIQCDTCLRAMQSTRSREYMDYKFQEFRLKLRTFVVALIPGRFTL